METSVRLEEQIEARSEALRSVGLPLAHASVAPAFPRSRCGRASPVFDVSGSSLIIHTTLLILARGSAVTR